jgi:membrane fusion protein, multidrug efflux system
MILKKIILVFSMAVLLLNVKGIAAQQRYSLEGLLEPSDTVDLSSPVQGVLTEILVERGDIVKKDQVVARLDSKMEKAALDLAQAKVEFSRRKVQRNDELYQKELLSIHDKDEMETELKILELQLRQAEDEVDTHTIRSSVDGVVVERFFSPGEHVGDDPVIKIARIDPLYVEVVVPAEKFGTIVKGTRAEVVLESPKAGKHSARVIVVDKVIDAASGTFGVRLLLNNPDYTLPAGLKCKVLF